MDRNLNTSSGLEAQDGQASEPTNTVVQRSSPLSLEDLAPELLAPIFEEYYNDTWVSTKKGIPDLIIALRPWPRAYQTAIAVYYARQPFYLQEWINWSLHEMSHNVLSMITSLDIKLT
jgi:hypothetical protein